MSTYSHLRKFHDLVAGGRQKVQQTRPNFDSIHMKLATGEFRQIMIRTLKNSFEDFVQHWKELEVELNAECYDLVVKEKQTTTNKLLVKISSGD